MNNVGQLGNGTTTDSHAPIQVTGLSNVTAVAAAYAQSYALKSDGTVWAWGYNLNSQLGDGTTTNRSVPVQVTGISGVSAIDGEYKSVVALKNDGTVWTWGTNTQGQLGTGTTTTSAVPLQVPGLSGVTGIAGGVVHTLALKNDGTVWTWGDNNYGEMGNNTTSTTPVTSPQQVPGLSSVNLVSAGSYDSLALKTDGTLSTWGYNTYGQLGNGSTTDLHVPTQVPSLTGVTKASMGLYTTQAQQGSSVSAWGYNVDGEVGDGSTTNRTSPVQISNLSAVQAVQGNYNGYATKSDGSLWAWGKNSSGEVGDGTTTNQANPTLVPGFSAVGLPGAPTGVAASPGDGSATLSWTAPAGGGPVNQYLILPSLNGAPQTPIYTGSSASTYAAAGLTNGGSYTFAITAQNCIGAGPPSAASASVRPNLIPGQVQALSATAGDGKANLAWSPPPNNGGTVDQYVITPYIGGTAQSPISTGTATTSAVVASLNNGTTYTFVVAAQNNLGTGIASTSSGLVTPGVAPSAPTSPLATAGNASATISWTAPQNTGTSAVTDYVIEQDSYPDGNVQRQIDVGGAGSNFVVAGLTNGMTYSFKIAAANVSGIGSMSLSTPAVTVGTAPAAPLVPAAANGGSGIVFLTWSAPPSDGGSPIVQYLVKPYVNGVPQTASVTGSTAPYFTLAGLTNGVSYTFSIAAQNTIGVGAYSPLSNTATPSALPSAPGTPTAVAANAQVNLTWVEPSGIPAPDSYLLYPYANGQALAPITTGSTATSYAVPLLVNGSTYSFAVAGQVAGAAGAPSPLSNAVTPDVQPGQPGTPAVTPGNGQATLTWSAAPDTGTPIVQYWVTPTANGHEQPAVPSGSPDASSVIPGLVPGTVYSFTVSAQNQLGRGTESSYSQAITPMAVPACPTITGVVGGGAHTLAAGSDGSVFSAGYGGIGALGIGFDAQRSTPVYVHGSGNVGYLSGVTSVAGGGFFSVALKTGGTVWTWGDNSSRQLGSGSSASEVDTPGEVVGPGGTGYLTGVAAVSAGYAHALALKADGTVWSWGSNQMGQLGDGTTQLRATPVQVVGAGSVGVLSNVVAISAGPHHSVAVKSDGTVWSWGDNTYGELGNNSTSSSLAPVQVVGAGGLGVMSGARSVVAGADHSLLLKLDGTVWAWGYNPYGGLGDGTTTNRSVPVQVVGAGGQGTLGQVASLAAGANHSLAVKIDGTVWAWGANIAGGLGNGGQANSAVPIQVNGVGGTGNLTLGSSTAGENWASIALRTDHGVVAWGENTYGQLGVGDWANRLSPAVSQFGTFAVPDATTISDAQAGNQSATVTVPRFTTGAEPTSYVITPYASGVQLQPQTFTPTSSNQFVVGGLINGVTYTFTATAQNCAGASPPSPESGPITPQGPPSPPGAVLAYPGNAQAQAVWSPSPSPLVNRYRVTPYIGSSPVPNYTPIQPPAGQDYAVVSGLANGQTYTIHVAASIDNGSTYGPETVSNPVTPTGALSDGLGLERFYPYQKAAVATGTQYTNLFTGNNVVQYADLVLPAQGLNMVIKRTYNSQRRDRQETLGGGWQLAVADGQDAVEGLEGGVSQLSITDTMTYLPSSGSAAQFSMTDGDGTTHIFTTTDGSTWQAPPGVNLTLRAEGAGFQFIRPDGVAYHIANQGNLLAPDFRLDNVTDRKGNKLVFRYEQNGLIHHRVKSIYNAESPSRQIVFRYNNAPAPASCSIRIPCLLGESTLASIIAPNGRTTTYQYDSGGRLVSATDASGTPDQRTTNFSYFPDYDPVSNPSGDRPGSLLQGIEDPNSVGNFYNRGHYTTTFTYTTDANYAGNDLVNPSPRRTLLSTITDRRAQNWDFYYGGAVSSGGRTRSITSGVQTTDFTDPKGNLTQYQIAQAGDAANGNLTRLTDAGEYNGTNITNYTWVGNRLSQTADPRGQVTQYQYDHLGDIVQVTRPAPNNAGANSSTVTDKLCYTYSSGAVGGGCGVDTAGSAVADLTDSKAAQGTPDERDTHFAYAGDGSGNLQSATQAYGQPEARTTGFTYYDLGRLATIKDANGNVTTYGDARAQDRGYDPSAQPLTITDAKGQVASFTYWPFGTLHTSTDRNGHTTTTTYSERDQLVSSRDPLGYITRTTYDLNGNTRTVQQPKGVAVGNGSFTTTSTFDNTDHLLSVIDAGGFTQSYTYEPNGNRSTMVSNRGNASGSPSAYTSTWIYFPDNRLRESSVPAVSPTGSSFALTDYTYYPDGRVNTVTGPGTSSGGRSVNTATWTPAGWLASEASQDGAVTHTSFYCYDAVGNQIYAREPNGGEAAPTCPAQSDSGAAAYVTRSYYDHLNQMTSQVRYVTDNGQSSLSTLTSQFKFDAVGNQTQISQPTGQGGSLVTHSLYDQLDRISQTDDPTNPGHTSVFKYKPAGQQSERDDSVNGTLVRLTTQTYNDNNTLQETDVTDQANGNHLYTRHYTTGQNQQLGYDANGNLLRTETWTQASGSAPVATADMTYDGRNLLSTYTQTITPAMPNVSSAQARTQTYQYDQDGNATSRQDAGSDTVTSSFAYWPSDQLHILTDPRGKTVDYGYELSGQLNSETLGNGVKGTSAYRQNGLLRSLTWASGSTSLLSYTGLSYDANNNKQSELVSGVQQGGATKSGTANYSYDEMNRLLSYGSPWADAQGNRMSTMFTMDDAGNMTKEVDNQGSSGGSTTTATYPHNRLDTQAVTATGPGANSYNSTFAYDGLGQETARKVGSTSAETSAYDAAGHTASHIPASSTDPRQPAPNGVTYVYDGAGRILERVEAGSPQKVYLHFYLGPTSTSVAEETNQAGAVQMRYTCTPGGQAVEQLDNISGHSNGWTWYGYDSRGNIGNRMDDGGTVQETKAYSPYGKDDVGGNSTDTNKTTSRLGFQGAWKDPIGQQYAIGARTYDPNAGRFTSADSYAGAGLDLALQYDPLTGNRYLYAGANPTGFLDDGHRFTTGNEDASPCHVSLNDGVSGGNFVIACGSGFATGSSSGSGARAQASPTNVRRDAHTLAQAGHALVGFAGIGLSGCEIIAGGATALGVETGPFDLIPAAVAVQCAGWNDVDSVLALAADSASLLTADSNQERDDIYRDAAFDTLGLGIGQGFGRLGRYAESGNAVARGARDLRAARDGFVLAQGLADSAFAWTMQLAATGR
jgi:RHS repeat-associated protein